MKSFTPVAAKNKNKIKNLHDTKWNARVSVFNWIRSHVCGRFHEFSIIENVCVYIYTYIQCMWGSRVFCKYFSYDFSASRISGTATISSPFLFRRFFFFFDEKVSQSVRNFTIYINIYSFMYLLLWIRVSVKIRMKFRHT